jgi:adenosine deaminase
VQWLTINAMKSAFAPFDERLALINTVIKPGFASAMAPPVTTRPAAAVGISRP